MGLREIVFSRPVKNIFALTPDSVDLIVMDLRKTFVTNWAAFGSERTDGWPEMPRWKGDVSKLLSPSRKIHLQLDK